MKPNVWLNHIIDKYDLKRVTPHGLRHTFATLAIESNELTIKQIQYQLGHSDASTLLNIYSHVSKNAKRDTINKFTDFVNF